MKRLTYPIAASLLMAIISCGGHTSRQAVTADTIALAPCPIFQTDSAMEHIQRQCAFGPRVTGSVAAQHCGDYIAECFRQYGAEVSEQPVEAVLYDGTRLNGRNIIARLNTSNPDRLLLCAHWDSRPWADNDPVERNWLKPVPAANDGASGVAVLLELCRLLQQVPIPVGIDFVCFDAEDVGAPKWERPEDDEDSDWCQGSQAWARQAATDGYRARYGILLDMVGGRGSTFARELISRRYAQPVVDMVWRLGRQLGYSHYFPLRDGGYLIDDHVPVNQTAHVPCIDIVPYFKDGPSSFGPTWHTLADTPENIDPHVLNAVGQTLTQLLYNEAQTYDN
ncbi:MAG: M28 family peptidase [Bacteroidaceae bacterium]|nr:M28 family peptidase [Bacteroidaceae bacterium]